MNTGLIIFAHGSSVERANRSVHDVAASVARDGGYALVEAAFLELASPDLAEAVRRLVARGATSIVVIPYFLTLGIHLQRDLPRLVASLPEIQNGVKIEVTEPLEGHPALREIVLDRARHALQRHA